MVELSKLMVSLSDTNSVVEKLHQFGVAIIKERTQSDTLDKIRGEFNKVISDPAYHNLQREYTTDPSCGKLAVIKKNQSVLDTVPNVKKLFNSRSLLNCSKKYLANSLLEKAFFLYSQRGLQFNSEYWFTYDCVGAKHGSQTLHYDKRPTLKFFLYLNDVCSSSGAFHCVPGSHIETRKIEKYNRRHGIRPTSTEADNVANRKNQVPIEGKAGTLFITHTDTVHRASPPQHGERLVIRSHTRLVKDLARPAS